MTREPKDYTHVRRLYTLTQETGKTSHMIDTLNTWTKITLKKKKPMIITM